MKKYWYILYFLLNILIPSISQAEICKEWYGPNGYIEMDKDGDLNTPHGVYWKSKKIPNEWYGPNGYIEIDKDGDLNTPYGVYWKSNCDHNKSENN